MDTVNRILCVMDSSHSSEDALRYAIAKAKQQHAELTVARVRRGGREAAQNEALPTSDNNPTSWSPLAEIDVETTCEELFCEGDPAAEIVELARRLSVDHIVIGTSGRQALNHVEMGRTARRVVKDAPCAVTVVSNEDVSQ